MRGGMVENVMWKRPAATLVEVLVALFVTSVGLLAILALFPLGALNMYQAIKDSRCSLASANAGALAKAAGLRTDANVTAAMTVTLPGPPPTQTKVAVYVDPLGKLSVGSSSIANAGSIP